ncbi:DUF6090 family protein [Spongiimicrobium sp. 3-5]|uniref:DUF6090 family protein n=1 Tax=Spongiimicrobium sp. 3-5 TaxID=3332596 RepID=UPI003980B0E3
MIKFFRRIRQRILINNKGTENNFRKYLFYALGEIVLVVIGILIALQINNWNEERKSEANTLIMLKQLKQENTANMLDLIVDKTARESTYPKMLKFNSFLAKQDIEKERDSLRVYLAEFFISTSYSFSESYLMSYINSNTKENSILSTALVDLHSLQEQLTYISEKGMDSRFENFYNVLVKDIDFTNLEINSYETLKSFEFRNKIIMMAIVEQAITTQYNATLQQQQKVDSIITKFLKE